MLKKILMVFIFLTTSIIYLYLFSGREYLFYLLFLFLLKVLSSYDRTYRKVYYLSYLILSFWGIAAAASYYVSYGETFGPYFDDTFYFDNISSVFSGVIDPESTLYEIIVGIVYLPFSSLTDITHLCLLPFNWFISSLVVVQAMKLAAKFYPLKHKTWTSGAFLLIIANSNYIDGVVHLYRDGLMVLFLLLCLHKATDKKYISAILFAILTGLIRGANGALALLYIFLMYGLSRAHRFSKSQLVLSLVFFLFVAALGDQIVGYSNYLRSFKGSNDSENISMTERLSMRYDRLDKDMGGVGEMIQSGNPVLIAASLPISMISPIKVKPFIRAENSTVWGWILRFRLESIWELGNILLWSFCFYPIVLGIWVMLKDPNRKRFGAILFYLIVLAAISYVSMQLRHKIGYIILLPILYHAYYTHRNQFNKRNIAIIQGCTLAVLLSFNIITS